VPVSTGRVIAEKLVPLLPPYGKVRPESSAEFAENYTAHAKTYHAPSKENEFANRFSNAQNRIRSLFGREEYFTDDESFEREYDEDMVDLLDVVGTYDQPSLKKE
jgi:hypothetical protein